MISTWINRETLCIQDALSPLDCDSLILFSEKMDRWTRAEVRTENDISMQSEDRTNSGFAISLFAKENKEALKFDDLLFNMFQAALLEYRKKFRFFSEKDEGYDILRYEKGQKYHGHVDADTGECAKRKVSAILYLNDCLGGGETVFPHLPLEIPPRRGNLFLFPANFVYFHEAKPPTNNTKYCVVTWFR